MSRHYKLFLAAIVPLVLTFGTVFTGASASAEALGLARKVPVDGFGLDPNYNPSAGETDKYNVGFAVGKTMPVTLRYVKPAGVTAVKASNRHCAATHGGFVCKFKKVCSCAIVNVRVAFTYAAGLPNHHPVKQKFIFSSPGYRALVKIWTQRIYNG